MPQNSDFFLWFYTFDSILLPWDYSDAWKFIINILKWWFVWFYIFHSILLPWDWSDPWTFIMNILKWFLLEMFFMFYDIILFTWFAKVLNTSLFGSATPWLTFPILLKVATVFCSQLLLAVFEYTVAPLSPSLPVRIKSLMTTSFWRFKS